MEWCLLQTDSSFECNDALTFCRGSNIFMHLTFEEGYVDSNHYHSNSIRRADYAAASLQVKQTELSQPLKKILGINFLSYVQTFITAS